MNTILALVTMFAPAQSQNIDSYVQGNLRDASFTMRVVKGVQSELKKINKDFGVSYRFESSKVQMKEPFKLRVEASVDDTKLIYVMNGPIQVMKLPQAKVNQREDLSDAPGRRQTPLDFGILTPSLFDGLFNAKFVRVDRATNDVVFDLTYKDRSDDTSRQRIFIDPAKKVITKREWFGQSGRQMATFIYERPTTVNGVSLSTYVTVKNVEGNVAGITRFENVKVNAGLPDSLFATQ